MNRQQRRHPTHPSLPIQYRSKKKISSDGYRRIKANTKPKDLYL